MRGLSYKPKASRFVYAFSDDWFIFARERGTGRLYYVNTELWIDWQDISEERIQICQQLQLTEEGPCPTEKFMLPLAKKKWRLLHWTPCISEYSETFCKDCPETKCLEYMRGLK